MGVGLNYCSQNSDKMTKGPKLCLKHKVYCELKEIST